MTTTRQLNHPQEMAMVVSQLVTQGKIAEAVFLGQSALQACGDNISLMFAVAEALEMAGRHQEAFDLTRSGLVIKPDSPEGLLIFHRLQTQLAPPICLRYVSQHRRYGSSIPKGLLNSIQRATHHYHYGGVPLIKNPFDFALYPMVLWEQKPQTIIEIGSKSGASALWLAHTLSNFGSEGNVISIDIVPPQGVSHPNVTFLEGNGRDLGKTLSREFLATLPRPWLVIEDADHAYETSLAVLRFFDPLLKEGEMIIIEDGIISDLANDATFSSGPHRAIKEFLDSRSEHYEIENRYTDFFGYNVTWCTNGFLRKTAHRPNPINEQIPESLRLDFASDDPTFKGVESQMSTNERCQLYQAMRLAIECAGEKKVRFIEIGSYSGASLLTLVAACQRSARSWDGFAIEPGGQPSFHTIIQSLRPQVRHLPVFSCKAAALLKNQFARDGQLASFILVDGDHSYQGVRQDALLYWDLLAPQGIIVFHDYLPAIDEDNRDAIFAHHAGTEPGVRRVCEEIMDHLPDAVLLHLPLLYPADETQTQPHLPIIPGVKSTIRAYQKQSLK